MCIVGMKERSNSSQSVRCFIPYSTTLVKRITTLIHIHANSISDADFHFASELMFSYLKTILDLRAQHVKYAAKIVCD